VELENTDLAVTKWISGKLTLKQPKSHLILVQYRVKKDVKELIVVIMPVEIDTKEYVTKMDAILTLTD